MNKRVIAVASDIECSTLYDKVGGDLLSMAFVEVYEDYTLGRTICLKSKATNPIYFDEKSSAVHGFSYWKAVQFPERIESINKAIEWLAPLRDIPDLLFLNYANGKFDHCWLENHFEKEDKKFEFLNIFRHENVVNVLKMAKDNYKNIDNPKTINKITGKLVTTYSLRNVCDFLKIDLDHHEALSDALACAQIWCDIKQGKNTWTGTLF